MSKIRVANKKIWGFFATLTEDKNLLYKLPTMPISNKGKTSDLRTKITLVGTKNRQAWAVILAMQLLQFI